MCWRSQWHTRGPPVEVEACDEVIYPGELPVGFSTLQSRGPCSLSTAHWRPSVEPPRTCSPSSPMQAPNKRSSVQWMRFAFLVNCLGAQRSPVVRPPFTFGCNVRAGFEFSQHAQARPSAAALGDEGFALSGELGSAWRTVVFLPDPSHVARGRHLSVHVQFVTCQVTPHVMLCM